MRRTTAFAALLAAFASPAAAEDWRMIDYSEIGVVYIDLDTIARTGDIATSRVWTVGKDESMDNFKADYRIDCKTKSTQVKVLRGFMGRNPIGEVVRDLPPETPKPGTLLDTTMKVACSLYSLPVADPLTDGKRRLGI